MKQSQKKFNNIINPAVLNSSCAFSLENVSIDFRNIKALDAVSLNIAKGEILFVTGPSGAGKTTLLNVLAGDKKPDNGRAYLGHANGRGFISRVFQDLRLLPSLTCCENLSVSYDPSIHRNKKTFENEMMELCRVVGIQDLLLNKVRDINGGAKQKVAVVRALLTRPDTILADEPTCSMDKDNAMKIFDVLNYYNTKRSLTVIWASHNRELVRNFPGKIIHLDHGRLVYSGHACFI